MSSRDIYKPADKLIGQDKNVWYVVLNIIVRDPDLNNYYLLKSQTDVKNSLLKKIE